MKILIALSIAFFPPATSAVTPQELQHIPSSLVRVTASAEYRLLGFASLAGDGMQYTYYLQRLELDKVFCTRKIDQISGPNETAYEDWKVFPAVLHLTRVTGPSQAELVTITPARDCTYKFTSKPAEG
jgi:hypothetical protein